MEILIRGADGDTNVNIRDILVYTSSHMILI